MKYALIQDERICEFVPQAKDRFPVHKALVWVQVANGTTTEDTFVDGKVVKFVAPIIPYDILRKYAYPLVGDQLDMLYWDQLNGTTTFQDYVAAVKAAHPKP